MPIIALTANADPEDAKAYIAGGMQCVVEKPIKPEQLLAAINAALPDGASRAARLELDASRSNDLNASSSILLNLEHDSTIRRSA